MLSPTLADQIEQAVRTCEQADATVLFVGDTHVAEFSDRTWNGPCFFLLFSYQDHHMLPPSS